MSQKHRERAWRSSRAALRAVPYAELMSRDLRAATMLAADSARPNRFHANISEDWTIVHVFGGVLMYTALRAMSEVLTRDGFSLMSATALFLAPVPPGPLTIDVDVLRSGRRAAQLAADLVLPGNDTKALRVHAVFGAYHDIDFGFQDVECPVVPSPNEVNVRRHSPLVHFNFDDRTEWRPVSGVGDLEGSRVLSWERLHVGGPDLMSLALHSDVLGLAVEQRGPYTVLSLEIGIRFIHAPTTPWVLQEIYAWHVGDGYATGPARLWDEDGRLCAIVTQTAQIRPAHSID